MRLAVLCIDGLDHRHVDRLRLSGVAQEWRGTHRVDVRYNSVQLWKSFLTGRDPSSFNPAFVETAARFTRLRPLVPVTVRRLLYRVRARPPRVPVHETLVGAAENPLVLNMFALNEEPRQFRLRLKYSLPKIVGNPETSREAFLEWEKWTRHITAKFIRKLSATQWDLALTHVYITDIAGHLAADLRLSWMVGRAYRLVNQFAEEVRKVVLETGGGVLIVSDHGMRRGIHSPWGFWSTSFKPPFTPRTITDFRRFVEVILHEH